jgi:Mrp family chromosome partitioning ATPase
VLLVDCDLAPAARAQRARPAPEGGPREVLTGEVAFEEAVMRADGADLDVLAVRDRPVNPSELLSSPGMRDLIASVASATTA